MNPLIREVKLTKLRQLQDEFKTLRDSSSAIEVISMQLDRLYIDIINRRSELLLPRTNSTFWRTGVPPEEQ